jgi:HAMP domain-containing protein
MKLLLKLASVIIVLMLCAFVVIFYVVWISNVKTLKVHAKQEIQSLAVNNMDKIDRNFSERMVDLMMISGDPIIMSRKSTPLEITERLIKYRDVSRRYVSLSFFDLNRVRIADTSGMGLGKQNSNFKDWDAVLQGKPSVAADVGLSATLRVPVIFFATLVKDKNNTPLGVLVTRMQIDRLYEILGRISLGSQILGGVRKIELVNHEGLLLYSNYNRKGVLKDKTSDLEDIKGSSTGVVIEELTRHEGEGDILVFCREQGYLDFKGNDWTMLIHVSISAVIAPIIVLRNRLIFIMLPIIMLAIALVLFFSFRLSKPITRLKDAVIAFGKGGLDTRVKIESSDEVGELGNAFNQMAEDLKETTISIDSLNQEISERKKMQAELREKIGELEDFSEIAIDRELDMKKLEEELEKLQKK